MGPYTDHKRVVALDGLRGWAALAVVFYHTTLASDPSLAPEVMRASLQQQPGPYRIALKFLLALCSGEVAVSIFFVLSGLVLFRALDAMHRRNAPLGTVWRFLLRRTLRIWPVMAVCLVVETLGFRTLDTIHPNLVHAPSTADLIQNLALAAFPVNGATWTLLVELAAAPLLLLAFAATNRFGRWAIPALGAYAVAAIKVKVLLGFSPELATGFPFLLAGAAIACGWYAPLLQGARRAPIAAAAAILLAAGMLLVPSSALILRAAALLFAVPVLVAAIDASPGSSVLTRPLSRWLGAVSFSLYLWNVPVFELLLGLLGPAWPATHPLEAGLGVGAAAVALTLPIAWASERWLEQPSIRIGRDLTRPDLTRPAASAQPAASPPSAPAP